MIPVINPAIPRAPWYNRVKQRGEYLRAYELGSLALTDPTGGLEQQLWTADCFDGKNIYIESRSTGRILLFPNVGEAITELDMAFDQNMYPFFTWMDKGIGYFYWYDTSIGQFVITRLPDYAVSPRCCLDDHRDLIPGNSDIILTYIRKDILQVCALVQRERYEIEHNLISLFSVPDLNIFNVQDTSIRCVNMSLQLRLQWEFDQLRNTVEKKRIVRTTQSSAIDDATLRV